MHAVPGRGPTRRRSAVDPTPAAAREIAERRAESPSNYSSLYRPLPCAAKKTGLFRPSSPIFASGSAVSTKKHADSRNRAGTQRSAGRCPASWHSVWSFREAGQLRRCAVVDNRQRTFHPALLVGNKTQRRLRATCYASRRCPMTCPICATVSWARTWWRRRRQLSEAGAPPGATPVFDDRAARLRQDFWIPRRPKASDWSAWEEDSSLNCRTHLAGSPQRRERFTT